MTVIIVVSVIGYMLGVTEIESRTHPHEETSAPAPLLTLPALSGGKAEVPDGKGWTLVHFWATWCGPCIAELPALQAMADEMKGRLQVVTINVDELEAGEVARWMGRRELTLTTLLDPEGTAMRAWGVVSLPTSYLVSPAAMVVGRADGARDWQDEAVRAFLKEKMNP